MTNLLDYIMDLFRDPVQGEKFVKDPEQAMREAGVQNVTAAQVQVVAATAAPSVALGHGDPVVGLQRAVAQQHGIVGETFAPTFQPEHVFAPETSADVLSHNDTRLLSPETNVHDDHSVNLDFGDISFGNKTTAVGDGAVAVGHDSNAPILSGDGAVLGSGNNVNNGDIHTGAGSNVTVGSGNEVHNSSQNAGGDVISDNNGPVIRDVDMSGGNGGNANAHGGIIGGGDATAGNGGNAGSINIDSHDSSTVFGDQTNVSTHGDVGGNVDAGHHDDNSTGHNVDNSTGHNVDNSVHDSHNATTDTNVDAGFHGGDIGFPI